MRAAASWRSSAAILGNWIGGYEKEGSCTEGSFKLSALMLERFTEGNEKEGSCTDGSFMLSALMLGNVIEGRDTGICLWAASRRSLAAFVP